MFRPQYLIPTTNKYTVGITASLRSLYETQITQLIINYYSQYPQGQKVTLYVANQLGNARLLHAANALGKTLNGIKIALGMLVAIIAETLFPRRIETSRTSSGKAISYKSPVGGVINSYARHRLI